MKKLKKSDTLYWPASVIESAGPEFTKRLGMGAVCGKCRALDPVHPDICHLLGVLEGEVSATNGVCGAYLPGRPMGEGGHNLTKEQVAYIEKGPTFCGRCEYERHGAGLAAHERLCAVIEGTIEAGGCCGAWDK